MCIIGIKKPGMDMPGTETIQNMWYSNPDGAGIMWNEKGKVHIEKGFMTLEAFEKRLEEINPEKLKDKAVVMHFRITTHGGTCKENCHPFPVTGNKGMLGKPILNTDLGMAHNGIITAVTPRKGISDTMEYDLSQLSIMKKIDPKFYLKDDWLELIENAIESKMVFLDPKGNIRTVGNFEESEGILYSNNSYKSCRKRWSCGVDNDSWYTDSWKDAYGFCSLVDLMSLDEWVAVDGNRDYILVNNDTQEVDLEAYELIPAIDKDGKVYIYDWNIDTYTEYPDWKALDENGSTIRFNRELANREYIVD